MKGNAIKAGILFISGIFLTALAFSGLFGGGPGPAPTAPPTFTALNPIDTATPLYQQVTLRSSEAHERGQPYGYTITTQTPVLVGSNDPRVQAFNDQMKSLVEGSVTAFKQNLANLPPTPDSAASTLEMRFNEISAVGNLISLKFDTQTYYTGAAHPSDTSQTVNFDLEAGRMLTLTDLFTPGTDFLGALSKYCTAQLSTRDIGFQGFELGATATPQNYRNWNLTADGLMITFDEYQVAPYAAGPQIVVVPYQELAQLIRPDGPLALYLNQQGRLLRGPEL